jgi:hypothetical protein
MYMSLYWYRWTGQSGQVFTEVVMRTFSYSVESKWMSPYTNAGVSGNEGSNTIWCVVDLPDSYV